MQKKRRANRRRQYAKRHIIALGGSVVAPDGVDYAFLAKFRAVIKKQISQGHRFIIVIGGGGIAREYQRATRVLAPNASAIELDTVGMRATQLNAELARVAFGKHTHARIIASPERLLYVNEPIAVAAGWMPGYSTDTVAVRIAEEIGERRVIVAGRPAFVYDRDFARFPNAKPFTRLSWKEYGKLIQKKWRPGMAAPVDPVAAERAARMGISVAVVRGTQLSNLERLLNGKPFKGTVIE